MSVTGETATPDPRIPAPLQRRSNDEFVLPPPDRCEREAGQRCAEIVARISPKLGVSPAAYAASRLGTATALLAIDAAAGGGYYDIPPEATRDRAAADEALGGAEFVVDVQTHYVGRGRATLPGTKAVLDFIRNVAPQRFADLDRQLGLSFAEYLRCVYLESETAVAILTAAPGRPEQNILPNDEIAGTRALFEQLGRGERLLHHAIVHPNDGRELERLDETLARHRPCGLKVYTLFGSPRGRDASGASGWMLDDEHTGLPFLERARALGVRRICAHKGLSALAPAGSPSDIGPAARAFPDLDLLVYHSGYEIAMREGESEGPYSEAERGRGCNRLVASLRDAGIAPGANVYAELGSTWAVLMRRPREAAHVLGKLLLAVGEDHVLWGTDSVWYGAAQPLIDAFRAFDIPEEMCDAHGYPRLTDERKAKILGLNAARVYGIDAAAALRRARSDEMSWIRSAIAEERERGSLARP